MNAQNFPPDFLEYVDAVIFFFVLIIAGIDPFINIYLKIFLNRCMILNMGRIDPVEYVEVSQQRNGNVRNIIHPLCGCATLVIQKITFPL